MKLPTNEILIGDALARLKEIPDASIDCCITSPPYWGLRDYGVDGQVGLEKTPGEFIERLVAIFQEVKRTLRDDGTAWVNMGDSYSNVGKWGGSTGGKHIAALHGETGIGRLKKDYGNLKPKDLCGIPWRLAFALQADGWYLRSDIIWAKPNPMPESVTDRPTKSHEYVFLLSKSERYYYDADAIKEPAAYAGEQLGICRGQKRRATAMGVKPSGNEAIGADVDVPANRNRRSVWSIPTSPFADAHFATFPEALVQPCILAGCRPGGMVLDPFMGAGTVALVALKAARTFMGVELNPKYAEIARQRIEPELTQLRLG